MDSTFLHLISLFLLLLFFLPCFALAQTYQNRSLGSSLSTLDNKSWASPSGDFAFGFRQIGNNNLFLLAIWFDKIPDKTIVWYANGDKPAPKGSKLELTINGRLVLSNPQGQVLWEANIVRDGVAYAAMLDTGNFLLARTNSEIIWQSFDNPTDTILPTQILQVNGMLSSQRTETNYSKGKFQLRLLEDGNLVLNTIGLDSNLPYDAYYISNTKGASAMDSGYQVVFNGSANFYVERRNGEIFSLKPAQIASTTEFYYRATLDFDGVFAQYSHPRSSNGDQRWSTIWSIPDNICLTYNGGNNGLGSGICGFNSYCVLETGNRPNCECPSGYSLVDSGNKFSGCEPDFRLGCEDDASSSPENLFRLEGVTGIDWPTSDYERLEPYNEKNCRDSCLKDCHCVVAISRGETCWKKKLPLSYGSFNGNDGAKALIKIRTSDPSLNNPSLNNSRPPNHELKKNPDSWRLVLSILLGSSAFVNFGTICLILFFIYHKKLKKIGQNIGGFELTLRSFSYKHLEKATNGFKEELGRGAFGIVYKGFLEFSSEILVAVKKLDTVIKESEREFKSEVSIIGQTHHKNLVRLLGYCEEGNNRLLVYEFMKNGTLASFLFGDFKPDWNQRVQIVFGTARGLVYLHEECSTQIIHCDIKPQNILLDENYSPKVSDFGMAKLLMVNQSRTSTGIRGTKGYVAPEWFRNTPITAKVDVYSFGVVLLEIICCRKNVKNELEGEEVVILTDWVYDCYCEGILNVLVEGDTEEMNDMRRVERFVMVAIWCIQEDPFLRPTMKKVSQMLEGVVDVCVPPPPSPFSSV